MFIIFIIRIDIIKMINDNELKQNDLVSDDIDLLIKKYDRYKNKRNNKNNETETIVQYGKPNEFNVAPVISVSHSSDTNRNDICNDPYLELLESKNDTINDLQQEITKLKQKIVDLTRIYNTKIEYLYQEHQRELHKQYQEFMKKKGIKNETTNLDE
jgi:hypothetical protein